MTFSWLRPSFPRNAAPRPRAKTVCELAMILSRGFQLSLRSWRSAAPALLRRACPKSSAVGRGGVAANGSGGGAAGVTAGAGSVIACGALACPGAGRAAATAAGERLGWADCATGGRGRGCGNAGSVNQVICRPASVCGALARSGAGHSRKPSTCTPASASSRLRRRQAAPGTAHGGDDSDSSITRPRKLNLKAIDSAIESPLGQASRPLIDVLLALSLRLSLARKGRGFPLLDGDVPPRQCSWPS